MPGGAVGSELCDIRIAGKISALIGMMKNIKNFSHDYVYQRVPMTLGPAYRKFKFTSGVVPFRTASMMCEYMFVKMSINYRRPTVQNILLWIYI